MSTTAITSSLQASIVNDIYNALVNALSAQYGSDLKDVSIQNFASEYSLIATSTIVTPTLLRSLESTTLNALHIGLSASFSTIALISGIILWNQKRTAVPFILLALATILNCTYIGLLFVFSLGRQNTENCIYVTSLIKDLAIGVLVSSTIWLKSMFVEKHRRSYKVAAVMIGVLYSAGTYIAEVQEFAACGRSITCVTNLRYVPIAIPLGYSVLYILPILQYRMQSRDRHLRRAKFYAEPENIAYLSQRSLSFGLLAASGLAFCIVYAIIIATSSDNLQASISATTYFSLLLLNEVWKIAYIYRKVVNAVNASRSNLPQTGEIAQWRIQKHAVSLELELPVAITRTHDQNMSSSATLAVNQSDPSLPESIELRSTFQNQRRRSSRFAHDLFAHW